MRVVSLIPARGGSKGIKNKNLQMVGGQTLLARAISVSCSVKSINSTYVSTDSLDIKRHGLEMGAQVPFVRPNNLSTDTASVNLTIAHFLSQIPTSFDDNDLILLLQPTFPFRKVDQIETFLNWFVTRSLKSAFSVSEISNLNLNYVYEETPSGIKKVMPGREGIRRQDLPNYFVRDGNLYASTIGHFKSNNAIYDVASTPIKIAATNNVNIDSESDLSYARFLADSGPN